MGKTKAYANKRSLAYEDQIPNVSNIGKPRLIYEWSGKPENGQEVTINVDNVPTYGMLIGLIYNIIGTGRGSSLSYGYELVLYGDLFGYRYDPAIASFNAHGMNYSNLNFNSGNSIVLNETMNCIIEHRVSNAYSFPLTCYWYEKSDTDHSTLTSFQCRLYMYSFE